MRCSLTRTFCLVACFVVLPAFGQKRIVTSPAAITPPVAAFLINPTAACGACSPSYAFATNGIINSYIGISGATNGGVSGTAAGDIFIRTPQKLLISTDSGATASVTILPSGNVGIGTNTPSSRIEVNGTAHVTGSLTVGPGVEGSLNIYPNGDVSTTGNLAVHNLQFADGSVQTSAARKLTDRQIATLHWYNANTYSFSLGVGSHPVGLAFDGAYIWSANAGGNSVSAARVSSGTEGAPSAITATVCTAPAGLAYDGLRIWVACSGDGTLAVAGINGSGGIVSGPSGVVDLATPQSLAFDGTNIWVTNFGGNTITKVDGLSQTFVQTVTVGLHPYGIAFDGTNLWVSNYDSNTVTQVQAYSGLVINTITVGSHPEGVAFDGSNIWVANSGTNTVSKIRVTDGAVLGPYTVGSHPAGVAFDGANIWVTNYSDNSVTKLRVSDGTVVNTFGVQINPIGIAFDGLNIWVANNGSSTIARR